jgi:hypothetical protein
VDALHCSRRREGPAASCTSIVRIRARV